MKITTLTKFRTSNHDLFIEKGRHSYPKIPIEERICEHCTETKIEDELHFFMQCPKYHLDRQELIQNINFTQEVNTDDKKFIFLMRNKNSEVIKMVGKYVNKLFWKRKNT